MIEGAKEMYGSVKVWVKNPKSAWWNDKIKATIGERMLLGRRFFLKRQKKFIGVY